MVAISTRSGGYHPSGQRVVLESGHRGDAQGGRPMAVLVQLAGYERLQASRAERFRVYELIEARRKRISPAKLDRAIEEAVRAARRRG